MVTIIIPTYNEVSKIINIQKQLIKLKGEFEVIFVDGFSEDGTFEQIKYRKLQTKKSRSNQMNTASYLANGDYIWFLHADSILQSDSISAIENSNSEIGCFSLKFSDKNPLLKLIAFFSNLRVDFRNIAFGDQGIFIKKTLFFNIGKYSKIPLMEDYDLSLRLKKYGYKFKRLKTNITTSPRRFKKNGIIKTIILMQVLQYKFRKGDNIYEICKRYK